MTVSFILRQRARPALGRERPASPDAQTGRGLRSARRHLRRDRIALAVVRKTAALRMLCTGSRRPPLGISGAPRTCVREGKRRSGATDWSSLNPGRENRGEQDVKKAIAATGTGRPPMAAARRRVLSCVCPIRSDQGGPRRLGNRATSTMRPLATPSAVSRTSILPMRKRASQTVSTGSSARGSGGWPP